jgi:hypothetical protein
LRPKDFEAGMLPGRRYGRPLFPIGKDLRAGGWRALESPLTPAPATEVPASSTATALLVSAEASALYPLRQKRAGLPGHRARDNQEREEG